MISEISTLIADLSVYSLALPAVMGLLRYFRLSNVQKAIWAVVLLSVLIDLIARQLRHAGDPQTLVYYLFTLCEFSLFTYLFAQALVPFIKRRLLLGLLFFFLLFVLIDMIWLSGLEQFNSYSTAVEGLLVIFLTLCYFYKTLRELRIKYLEREPVFWVSTGVLLYYSSNLFIFLFTNFINSSLEALYIIWGIHGIFSILLNILYAIALWVTPQP
jgi:hypothetical protein